MKNENKIPHKSPISMHIDPELRSKSLDWFFTKSSIQKTELKEKYFPDEYIPNCDQWGYHFTFGQIEKMYSQEHSQI